MSFEIEIEKEENPSFWKWHNGTFRQNGNEHFFTVVEMYDSNSDTTEFDVTFVDEFPENYEEVKQHIISSLQ